MPSLKAIVESLNDVPEALHEFYAEKDGKYYAQLEGAENEEEIAKLKNALKRQQDDNKGINKDLKKYRELAAQFEGIDPEIARSALEKIQEIEDKKLIDSGQIEELVKAKTHRMQSDYEAQLKSLQDSLGNYQSQYEKALGEISTIKIDNKLASVAPKLGVRPEAIEDVITLGRNVFRIEDGVPVPYQGDEVVYGKEGKPMTMEEWIPSLAKSKPHYFLESQGSGASNNGSSGRGPILVDPRDPIAMGNHAADFISGKAVVKN